MRRWGGLAIEFVGERHELNPNQDFSFGRFGDLAIDTNRELPALIGVLSHDNGIWWLANTTESIDLHLLDVGSRSAVLVAPNSEAPVGFERSVLRMAFGLATYELTLIGSNPDHDTIDIRDASVRGTPSRRPRSAIRLNDEQLLLLIALAEDRLRGQETPVMPSNAEVADRLGWRITKLNRKLDHLCIKFDKLGVTGLRGSSTRLATARRRRLIDYCIATEIVRPEHLSLLPEGSRT